MSKLLIKGFIQIKVTVQKNIKLQVIIYQKLLLRIINGRNIYDQPTDSGEGYTIGCFLNSDYIKNHYRLIAEDKTRQK